MATRAEVFRSEVERSGPKRPARPRRPPRNAPVDTAEPGVSATDRKGPSPHRESKVADRKAAYVLEDSATTPARRSTRKASNRQRTDVKMIKKRRVSLSRPSAPQAKRGR
jgi:hypothetical protein